VDNKFREEKKWSKLSMRFLLTEKGSINFKNKNKKMFDLLVFFLKFMWETYKVEEFYTLEFLEAKLKIWTAPSPLN
jgi:hypothetical protein